jgi:hypothetical protein
MARGSGRCKTEGFTEEVYDPTPVKLARSHVTTSFEGEIQGNGVAEYLMAYCQERSGSFVGLERVTGRIGDRAGAFVVQHSGSFQAEKIESNWAVVAGSATGGLRGLTGTGQYRWESRDGPATHYVIDYEFR